MIIWTLLLGVAVIALFYFQAGKTGTPKVEQSLPPKQEVLEKKTVATEEEGTAGPKESEVKPESSLSPPTDKVEDDQACSRNNSAEPKIPEQLKKTKKVTLQEQTKTMSSLDDLDDILDAACDDLDDMLDLAADDLMDQDPVVETEKVVLQSSRTVPKVWQEALNVLPIKEKIEWAGIIQSDISKQAKESYSKRAHSKAYVSGKLSGRENLSDLTYIEVMRELLKRSLRGSNKSKSTKPEFILKELENDKALLEAFKSQISTDLTKRLKDLSTL